MQKFPPLSAQKWCKFLCVIQKYTKFVKFAGLYFPHFTTFRDQTLQFYSFSAALSSCSDGFRSSCLDKNLAYSWNRPLLRKRRSVHSLQILRRRNVGLFSGYSVQKWGFKCWHNSFELGRSTVTSCRQILPVSRPVHDGPVPAVACHGHFHSDS